MNSVFRSRNKSAGNSKKVICNDPTSYENLRHIRELAISSKMTECTPDNGDFADVEGENLLGVTKLTPTPIQSPVMSIKHEILGLDFTEKSPETDVVDSSKPKLTNGFVNGHSEDTLNLPKLENQNHKLNVSSSSISSSDGSHKDDCNSFINNVKNNRSELGGFGSRFLKPRLSLSSASNGNGVGGNSAVNNNTASMPSVHRRSNGAISSAANGNNGSAPPTRTRLSTHQRNLSLDFR